MTDFPMIFSGPMIQALNAGRKTMTRRLMTRLRGFGQITEFGRSDTKGYDWHFRDKHALWNEVTDWRVRELLPCSVGDRLWVREACRAEELSRPQTIRAATNRERAVLKRTEVVVMSEDDGADGVRYLADDAWRRIENTSDAGDRWVELYHYRGRGENGRGHTVPPIHMPRWASRFTLTVRPSRLRGCRISRGRTPRPRASGLGHGNTASRSAFGAILRALCSDSASKNISGSGTRSTAPTPGLLIRLSAQFPSLLAATTSTGPLHDLAPF